MSLWQRIFAERRALLVPLIALVIVDVALVAGVVVPLLRSVSGAAGDADQARVRLALANQRMRQMQAARTSRDRATTELAKFYGAVLPTNQAAAARVGQLEIAKLAKENNLRLGNRSFEDEAVKDSPLRRLSMKVELEGDYTAIRHFLYDVETAEAFLVIRSVSLSQAIRQQQSAALQLALEMATYYRPGGRQ